jgi:hypothetical protein
VAFSPVRSPVSWRTKSADGGLALRPRSPLESHADRGHSKGPLWVTMRDLFRGASALTRLADQSATSEKCHLRTSSPYLPFALQHDATGCGSSLARVSSRRSPLATDIVGSFICSHRNLSGQHSLEFLQRGINRVPRMAADAVCERLRTELAWVVKAGCVDRDQFRHCDECEVDRRSTDRAEGVDLFVPAIARDPPAFCFAGNCHIGSLRERQVG